MNNQEVAHAIRYATEASKVFLMEEYKKQFPHYFQNAILETRPATNKDYFIPPSIANKCVVVVETRFDETGCKRFGCFPFKENLERCEENDPTQWIRIGKKFELSCQKSCQEHSIDTEWVNGQCILSNPLKKFLALMPENLFQRASRHIFHGGLDIVDGNLKLNNTYCEAYGLDFVDDDCVASGGQKFGEWLLGTTAIRAAKVGNLAPYNPQPFPPLPNFINYKISKSNRNKRFIAVEEPPASPIYHQIAVELSKDLGREVSEWAVENFLKKKAPKLLSKALNSASVRVVLKNSVVVTMKQMGSLYLKALGNTVGIATTVYALYEMVIGVLDAMDPYDYLKVLDKKMLDQVNRELDYTYYQDGSIRPELTPEYVWENQMLGDDDDKHLAFMSEKVEEYLTALQAIPPNEYHRLQQVEQQQIKFVWLENEANWNDLFFKCIIFIMICLTLLFLDWIHVWACCLFFVMLFYKAY